MYPDFYGPSYKTYNMNLPVTTGPASVSSLSGGSGMEPISTTAAVAYGLQSLSNWLTGRGERKQRERELEEQRQRWLEELRRQRTVSRRVRPLFEELKGMNWGDFSSQE